MKDLFCPGCHSGTLENFYTLHNAPSESTITIKDKRAALSIPRNNIDLCFCHNCGFIFNSAFDTSYKYFTKGYEDQQGFSRTFRQFISTVTNRFIARYNMREKKVLEIGCGKGDFLSLFCDLGNNVGIGIDPAWIPGRINPSSSLHFIPEFFAEKHGELKPDCICCRHTLEHIYTTDEFFKTIRKSIGDREDVIVFIEVPSILRILKTQAFWDIFNEHCAYFSPGSLARLLRAHRFEVLDIYLEYDQQYLFLEAKPVKEISTKTHPLEESVKELYDLTRVFSDSVSIILNKWREKLIKLKEEKSKTVIWGGGSKAVGFLTNFDDIGLIEYVVDINPHMEGNFIPGIGKQYVKPEFLTEYQPDAVIIMNGIYKDEITNKLNEMNLYPKVFALDILVD